MSADYHAVSDVLPGLSPSDANYNVTIGDLPNATGVGRI